MKYSQQAISSRVIAAPAIEKLASRLEFFDMEIRTAYGEGEHDVVAQIRAKKDDVLNAIAALEQI